MPLYEEKLISPLAVRFTQQRIRKIFRDGHEVEATMKQIKLRQGDGDYDLILDAPFPAIEIIRWSPNGRRGGASPHWFSFDNRRLYCLQRLAADYWPKRVGAVVEVLYADSGAIRKKLDSQTGGLCVSIGHAFAAPGELEEWSWQGTIQTSPVSSHLAAQAQALVDADDAKANVHDLIEAPDVQNRSEYTHPEFDVIEEDASTDDKGEAAPAAEPVLPGTTSLTSLIGQLLAEKLNPAGEVQNVDLPPAESASEEAHASTSCNECDHVPGAASSTSPIVAPSDDPKIDEIQLGDGNECEDECKNQDEGTAQVSPPEASSLAGLIGQLLQIGTKQELESNGDDVPSTEASERPELTESDVGTSECSVLSSSDVQCNSESLSVSDEEDKGQQPAVSGEASDTSRCNEGVQKDEDSSPSTSAGNGADQAAKVAPKESASGEQRSRASKLRQAKLAQQRMAQWQMAQWQMAQVAQWQQAALAYEAHQAAWLQANQRW
jgi:hypothetical protein